VIELERFSKFQIALTQPFPGVPGEGYESWYNAPISEPS